MSRKWDAREAGREVARNTIKQLNAPPDFFLLFSTIHYRDHGGFEEFLNGVWDVLPKGTPLIGGTVSGFLNNHGCYTRGCSALAVSSADLDIVVGVGNNTKRNPRKAAIQCANMVKKGFSSSKFNNHYLLNFVSGACVMKIPGQGDTKVVNPGFMSKFTMLSFGSSQYLLQKGFAREDEFFDEMIRQIPGCHMMLGTSMDDYKAFENYQFFDDKILENSAVSLGISTNCYLDVDTTFGMKKTDINFKITKYSKYVIHEINNKPAVRELYKLLNWPENYITNKTIFNILPYYPISIKKYGRDIAIVMPGILGDSILIPCDIDEKEVSILTVSGRDIIQTFDDNIKSFSNVNPEFGLFSTCMTILATLGYNMNIVKDKLLEYFKEKPFLMFFSAGEGTCSPEKNITYANMSFNSSIFGKKLFPD